MWREVVDFDCLSVINEIVASRLDSPTLFALEACLAAKRKKERERTQRFVLITHYSSSFRRFDFFC